MPSETYYKGSAMWAGDMAEAEASWRVVQETTTPVGSARGLLGEIRFVRADAATGSNYVVITTPLDPAANAETGGPVLVTVCSPWSDSWALQRDGVLAASYVAEHLCQGRLLQDSLNGGDLAALTLTVAHALGREPRLNC